MNEQNYVDEMIWVPGRGPDEKRLRHLASQFTKPHHTLERDWWWDGERFGDCAALNAGGIESVDNAQLTIDYDILIQLIFNSDYNPSGWFGYLTSRILVTRRYLMPLGERLIGQMHEALLYISVFYKSQPTETEFAAILAPLIMDGQFWSDGLYLPFRRDQAFFAKLPYAAEVNRDFSTSLFLAWRYLRPDAIPQWFHSVVAIEDVLWRARLIVWLVQIWPVFEAETATIPILKKCPRAWPEYNELMSWTSYRTGLLAFEFVPSLNIQTLQTAILAEFTPEIYFSWLDKFSSDSDSWPKLEPWLEQFQQLFLE